MDQPIPSTSSSPPPFSPNDCEQLHLSLAASYSPQLPWKIAREHRGKRNEVFAEDYDNEYLSYAEGEERKRQKEASGSLPNANDLLVIHLEPIAPPPPPPAIPPPSPPVPSSSSRRHSINTVTAGLKKLVHHKSKVKEKSSGDPPSVPKPDRSTRLRHSTKIKRKKKSAPVVRFAEKEDDACSWDSDVNEPGSGDSDYFAGSQCSWDSNINEPDID